jgi:OmpA-OmpF porin, OOP family
MKVILLTGFLFVFSDVLTQNLVSNGSFEEFNECCKFYGQIQAVKDWFQLGGSTDYFNTCCIYQDFLGVPSNFKGYQIPKDGNAYVGIVLFSSADARYKGNGYYYREYVHTQLTEPLVKGKKYSISFYFNLADSSQLFTDHFSICFSAEMKLKKFKTPEPLLVAENHVCQKVGREAKDVNDWQLITFGYTANGSERYLVIGLFENDLSKSKYRKLLRGNVINEKGKNCYYYIDDVMVIRSDAKVEFSHENR